MLEHTFVGLGMLIVEHAYCQIFLFNSLPQSSEGRAAIFVPLSFPLFLCCEGVRFRTVAFSFLVVYCI